MIYAMADIHGKYDKYRKMLKKIKFSDNDTLYVLGDVVDRGEKPVELLTDMSMRPNVYPIMGNHEQMAIDVLSCLTEEITPANIKDALTADTMQMLLEWQENGGISTLTDFQKLSRDDRDFLLEYMQDFEPFETVELNGRLFILVHAGLGNFDEYKDLEEYSLYELAFMRFDYEQRYFNDKVFIVTGHTPTLRLTGKAEIYRSGNNFCIDCGASYDDGRLACLCLDTLQAYYV